MSEDARAAIARKTIVLRVPAMDDVTVRRDLPYPGVEAGVTFDLYLPAAAAQPPPLVLFVFGFPHPAFSAGLKLMGAYTSWGRLLAASGMAAVTYTYRDPVRDLAALFDHLRAQAGELGIDRERVALWAASGNGPTALGLLFDRPPTTFRCAVLAYAFLLDAADAAAKFGFADPAAGKTIADLPEHLPLMLVRAGKDQTPQINQRLDDFVAGALARNLPLVLMNHATGPHAFDLFEDSDGARTAIRAIVDFLRRRLIA
jgi:acetyl esterase/lipase